MAVSMSTDKSSTCTHVCNVNIVCYGTSYCLLCAYDLLLPEIIFLSYLQDQAAENLVSLIRANKDRYRVVILGLHKLGKEDLLVKLATSLQQWVGVSPERLTTLKLLELPDVFSTDMSDCFIRVYPFYMVAKHL